MSQHAVEQGKKKFVYGWDQPLQTFFLQVHDKTRPVDDQIVVWRGLVPADRISDLVEFVKIAQKEGLLLDHSAQKKLFTEQVDGL